MRTEERFIFNRSPQWVQLRGQRRIQSSAPRTARDSALPVLQSSPCFSNHKAWFCETCNRTVSLDLWTFLLLFSAFLFVKSLNRVWSLTVDLCNTWRFYCIRWLIVNWVHRKICTIAVQKVTHRGHCITVFDSELKEGKAGIIISAFCEHVWSWLLLC